MTDTTAPAIPLAARINGARPWAPAKTRTDDAMLTGTIVAIQRRESEYGAYPCVIVEVEGEGSFYAFHAFHTVAREQLKALKPSAGESIAIVAHAPRKANKRKDANGDPVVYTAYTIFNPDAEDTAVAEFDWDSEEAGF